MPAVPFGEESCKQRQLELSDLPATSAMTVHQAAALVLTACVVLVDVLCSGALAQGDSNANTTAVSQPDKVARERQRLGAKLQLLQRMVHGSPIAQRVERSGDRDAAALLDAARSALVDAQRHLQKEDFAGTEASINTGLGALGTASRLVTDPEAARKAAEIRFREISERVESFGRAFERVAEEKGAEAVGLLDRHELEGLRSSAQQLVSKGEFDAANRALEKAGRMLEQALTKARLQETLVHERRFETVRDEYEYELRVNLTYVRLIELILAEGSAGADVLKRIDERRDSNDELQRNAQRLAGVGQFEAAIGNLEKGTVLLNEALRIGGLMVPLEAKP